MVKRKLDGAVDESKKIVNSTQLHITCEKSEGLHLVEPGITAGRLAGRPAVQQMKFGQGLKFKSLL